MRSEDLYMLGDLNAMVIEMRITQSATEKVAIFKNHKALKELLILLMDPMVTFGVTSAKIREHVLDPKDYTPYTGIRNLLESLATRRLSGYRAVWACLSLEKDLSEQAPEHVSLFWDMIDRDLKIRAEVKTFLKAYPGAVPLFSVALAYPFDKYAHKVLWGDRWYASRKFDGVRCLVIVDAGGQARAFSRTGREFHTLGRVLADVTKLCADHGLTNVVFDGEVALQNEGGADDFQGAMRQITRKDHTIESPRYYVFDFLKMGNFRGGMGPTLSARIEILGIFMADSLLLEYPTLSRVDQVRVRDAAHLQVMKDAAAERGEEGLIIRKDVPYVGKRSPDLLKIKIFFDEDFVVLDVECSPQRLFIDKKEVMVQNALARIKICVDGDFVYPGSGFDPEQRVSWGADPSLIIGKTVRIRHFGHTKDQFGSPSLRMPIFKGIRDEIDIGDDADTDTEVES